MPDPKKPWEKNFTAEDSNTDKKPWERNFDIDHSEKKKKNSGSTSPGPKSDLAPENGSSGFPTIEKPFEEYIPKASKAGKNKTRAEQLRKELAKVKVTPENMESISSKTDELSALQKESEKQKQAEKNYRVSQIENSFYNATQNNDDDAVAEQRLQDAIQTKGVWNNLKKFGKQAINAISEPTAAGIGALGSLFSSEDPDKFTQNTVNKSKIETDPLAEEKKQVISESKKNKEKLTDEEINQRAGELFKTKQKDNLFIDRANSFLDDLPENDKKLLMQDRAAKADHLEEDNLKRLKVTSAMRRVADNKISEYKDIENQLINLKDNNQPFPEDLYGRYQALGSEIKNIGNELQKNEDYILKNRKDLGTAQQELDLFKREYGDLKNFVGNIGASASELGSGLLGAMNFINSFSPNAADRVRALSGQKMVSDLDKNIAENRENLRKPVDQIESPEGFLNYASDLVANQLPILATTAAGAGGLSAIGASSTGKKFTEMNDDVLSGKANYSPLQMATAPLLYGGAEMAGEYATMGILQKGGRVLESIARGEGDLIKKTAVQKAKEWAKDFGVDMSKEMSGEQFTNFAQNFNDKYVLGKKDVNLLDNTGQVFKDTFTLTSILKAAPHVFGSVVRPFQSKNDLGTLDENSKKIIEFSRQLESEDLTDTERQVIEKQIEKATADSSKIVSNTIGKIDSMPTELYDEVIRLNGQAGEIKAQASEIANGNLPNKKQLLDGLQEDYKALQEQRNSIIEGQTSAVEVLPIKEQEKIKRQALEDLVTELNPDGKKDMTITNEQILERANEIYAESKNNEAQKVEDNTTEEESAESKREVNLPFDDTQSQQNGSELEGNSPQNEKTDKKPIVKENRVVEYTNGKGEKATLNTSDIEISEDKQNKLLFTENGNRIGHIEISKPENGDVSIKLSGIFNPSLEKKGIGAIMYKKAAELLKSKYNLDLVSDKQRTPEAEALWAKLERDGNAVVIGDKSTGNTADYQYKFVQNESQPGNDVSTNGGVRTDINQTGSEGQDTRVQDAINAATRKDEVTKKLEKINEEKFGLDKKQSKANYKGSEFTIEKKANGETKIFKKNGTEVKEYTWRKTKDGKKRVKNANYYKILAIADGNMTENEINKASKKKIKESIDNFIPSNEYEAALLEISKGTKFSKESLEKELGNTDSNWASDQFSKKKMTSIENVAEGIVAENEDLNLDEQEVRNALIDILGSNENLDSVRQQLNENYQKSIDPYFGLTEQEAINAYEEFMTDSERALFESVKAEENLSEDEKLQYYFEQYEKSIESIPAEDRARIYEQFESERPERLPNSAESNENGNSKESSGEQKTEKVEEKSPAEKFLDWIDEMENNLDQFGKENLSVGIPIVAAKAALQAMRTAVKAGQAVADVIQAGLDALKQTDWYKSLTDSEKTQAEKDFNDTFGNPQIDKDNIRQTENLMKRSASENISEDEAFDEVSKTFEKERDELRNKKPSKEYLRDAYRNFIKRFTDRQYLSKSLLSKSGLRNTKNLMINAHGASGKAKLLFEEAYNKIYKGLTRADRNTLDEIIQSKRFIAIDENRDKRGLDPVSHPNFIDKNKSEKFLSKLEKNLGEEKYKDLEKRAKEYFKTYKNLLQQVYDNGLISKESFDSMNNVDYQPRVFLQFVTDFNGDLAQNKRTNNLETGGLSSEQIKSMKEGDANSLVLNSEWLLTNSLLARQKAIAMNNINKRFMTEEYPKALKRYESIDPKNFKNKEEERFYKYFKELSSKVIDNPYVGETSGGNPKFLYDKTPANFQKAYYYVDGKQHQFFLEQELYESWVDKVGNFLDSRAKEALSYATGSALVKAIATGNNPAFPIVNTPRDFMFTTTFSDQYSNFVPKAIAQVFKDSVIKSVREIRKGETSDILKKYIEYGGAMDFLSSEGRLKKNSVIGRTIDKAIDPKFKDAAKSIFSKVTLSKISEYSEMMFRLGIFQRSIQNQLKDLGLNDISEVTDKQQLDDIYNEAVANARSILDFNQGGNVTKDLEALVPYINVAFQGGRVAATAFEKDPVGTTSRVLQVATLASAVPIGLSLVLLSAFKPEDDDDKSASEIYLHAMEGISTYQKSKYMNIPIPIKNADGEYMVIKIAKAQELSPVMSVTDDIYNNMIRSFTGQQKKTAGRILDDAAFTFNSNVMPIDFTSPAGFFTRTPIIKGTLTYTTGYDFFRDEPLSNDIGKVPLQVEGVNNPNVEDFYKKLGDDHKLSPIRSKAFVESLITGPNTNPFVGAMYAGLDASVSDKGMKEAGKDLLNSVYKSTGKRIISYPSDFNRKLAARKDLQEKIDQINIDKYKMKAEFNQLAKDYMNKDVSKEEVNAKLKELDPADRKRMFNKIKDKVRLEGIDGAILDIKYEQGNDVKALMIMHYYGDITDGSKDSKDVIRQMKRAKGVLTPGVMYEYNKLKKELEGK
jgi:hypothetical protein